MAGVEQDGQRKHRDAEGCDAQQAGGKGGARSAPAVGGIRSVLILGGGTAGWMAAAILSETLGARIAITLVESAAIGTIGVGEATIPPLKLFNHRLGIDEGAFLRAVRGSIKLGIEFIGWGAPGERYIHPFGRHAVDFDIVPLHQYWLRARALGHDVGAIEEYALAAVAARLGRADRPITDPRRIQSSFDYAYHLDATRYAAFLRGYAEERGVRRIEGRVAGVERDGETGRIARLVLDDGRRLAADFFLDCSGFRSLLLGDALAVPFLDWSHWLPCDRAVALPSKAGGAFTPHTQSFAHRAGWRWRIPLQHRIGNGIVYQSTEMSDEEAADTLLAALDGEPLAEPRLIRFTAGRRARLWEKNCVAIGLAGGFLEPLESTSIHLIQSALFRLLALWPLSPSDETSAREFNRLSAEEYERIRDFIILHYHANRRDEPFWRRLAAMAVPDELAERLAAWRACGRLVSPGPELFLNPSWLAVYTGQGVIPQACDPLADLRAGRVDADAKLAHLRRLVREAAMAMPEHAGALARIGGIAADAQEDLRALATQAGG